MSVLSSHVPVSFVTYRVIKRFQTRQSRRTATAKARSEASTFNSFTAVYWDFYDLLFLIK